MNLNDNARAGTFCTTNPAVIVDASAKADLEITVANMLYVIDGLHYTVASGDGDVPLDDTANTIADGYSRLYLACVVADGTVSVVVGKALSNAALAAGEISADWPVPTANSCPFCGILVTNATGSVFTAGTTTLDTTSIFADIYDLWSIPAAPLTGIATTQQT
ncbi:MAG: hypothetical protein DRI24_21590 [Deltaproteobacteria bacterium]|nr:MAG: hypothetical protein DRI24_21590 [Deltaproteobacteria bacterium]